MLGIMESMVDVGDTHAGHHGELRVDTCAGHRGKLGVYTRARHPGKA